jgi:hypothetical protein
MAAFLFLQQRTGAGWFSVLCWRLLGLAPGRLGRRRCLVFTSCKREIRMVFEREPLLGPPMENGRIMLHLTTLNRCGEIVDRGNVAFLARG